MRGIYVMEFDASSKSTSATSRLGYYGKHLPPTKPLSTHTHAY